MTPHRLLILRLGSMGDIVHALPVAAVLRAKFPAAYIGWLVDEIWKPLVEQVEGLDAVLSVPRDSWAGLWQGMGCVRRERFDCVVDVQGLYKSALLARLSGAKQRVGFDWSSARESGAALFYNLRVQARWEQHRIEKNLALAERLGARREALERSQRLFPLRVSPEAEAEVAEMLATAGASGGQAGYFVMSPGGGWRSKCWPAERYAELHARLVRRYAIRGLVSYGPGERSLAESVVRAAGEPPPLLLELNLAQLMAALHGARFFIGGDTGPLHLAAALGTPVVALYGPTDPAQTGPFSPGAVVLRNAGPEETTYRRGASYSSSMLSITVGQAEQAVVQRMALSRAQGARDGVSAGDARP